MSERHDPREALTRSVLEPLWLDSPDRPDARPTLTAEEAGRTYDLVVVGGGFTGLWAALRAKERDPSRDVLLLEGERIAEHATGRNGGFCEASLTHGEANGRERWPTEYDELERLGQRNLDEIAETIARHGIDCGFDRSGMLAVATRPHEVAALEPETAGFLDAADVRRVVDSPTYLAGRVVRDGCATLDPARLAWGLARVAEQLGVRIAEHTPVSGVKRRGDRVVITTDRGPVVAEQVVLATNVFRPLLKRLRLSIVPVYDYVLATEPLTQGQVEAIGWTDRVGISDCGNQFHYYRLTPDNRVLFGGYDAIYHFGRSVDAAHEDRASSYETLADHFFETFPQLKGVRFTHRWAGAIDTSTRFCAFFGVTRGRRIAYATGFTGLGVGASRFGADVMLDLLSGESTSRTRLEMVRDKPLPFPPEPFAWIGIQATRWSLAREDATGRRNWWLRLLDRLGLGFDS